MLLGLSKRIVKTLNNKKGEASEMPNMTETKQNESLNMDENNLLTRKTEELKKEELIGVLAGLIKNYAMKKQQK